MRPIVKRTGIGLGVLLLALLIAPFFIDVERHKGKIASLATTALGVKVTIDGGLSLSLLPPRLVAEGITVAGDPSIDPAPLVKLASLDIELAVLPLLRGQVEVTRLVLRQPQIQLIRAADGRGNWRLGGEGEGGKSEFAARIRIDQGRVSYRDLGAAGAAQQIDGIDANLDIEGRDGPFAGDLALGVAGHRLALKFKAGRITPDRPTPIKLDGRFDDQPWSFVGEAAATRLAGDFKMAALDIHFALDDDGDGVGISDGRVRLPGGSASFDGRVATVDGTAVATGAFTLDLKDLRAAAAAMAVDLDGYDPRALRHLALAGRWRYGDDDFALDQLDGRFDDSGFTGGLAMALRARPALRVKLDLDRIDVARYQSTAPAGQAGYAQPALAGFDAVLNLKVGQVLRDGHPLGALALDASLLQGSVTLEELALNADNASLTVKGTVRDLAQAPKLDLNLGINARSLSALAMVAGVDAPHLAASGPVAWTGTIAGVIEDVAVDGKGRIATLEGQVRGRVRNQAGVAIDLAFDGRHPSLPGLLRQFGIAEFDAIATTAPVKLGGKLTLSGDNLTAAGQIGVAAGSLSATYDQRGDHRAGTLAAKGRDVGAMLREFGFAYQPARADLGAVDVTLGFDGDDAAVNFAPLSVALGPLRFGGGGRLDLSRKVPYVDLLLKAAALPIDDLLPEPETGAAEAQGAGERWSDQPLPVEGLRAIDGHLRIEADSLTLRGYAFDTVLLEAALAGGRFELQSLSGKLFGGDAKVAAWLDAGKAVPEYRIDAALDGVDLDGLLGAALALRPISGKGRFSGQYQGKGQSSRAIVASLSGTGHLGAANGVIRKVDLNRLNRGLGSLGTVNDFVRLAGGTLGGGETAYRSIEVDLPVEKGVMRTRDFAADIDAAKVDFNAVVDLPAWTVDAKAAMALRDHPGAPPVGATITGDLGVPVIAYQTKALQKWLGVRLGAAILKGVTKGEGVGLKDLLNPAAPEPAAPADEGATDPLAPEAAPPPQTPEEEIRDALKGLFKKKR